MMKVKCRKQKALDDIEIVTVTCAYTDGDCTVLSEFDQSGFFLKTTEKHAVHSSGIAQIKVSAEDGYALGKLLVELYGNDDDA